MRRLLLVRGPQGSGKSTFIHRLGLDDYALSFDKVRTIAGGPSMTPDGRVTVSHENEETVVGLTRQLLEMRMARGETLALEQATMSGDDAARWAALARKWRYEPLLVDLSTVPLDVAQARNAQREEMTRVPEHHIERTVMRLGASPLPKDLAVLKWQGEATLDAAKTWLQVPVVDLSAYRQVIHIGDVQGCFGVLAGPGGPLAKGLDPECFYVFVGDLLDRGIENGEVLRWFLDNACGAANAVLTFGNHEHHLAGWARGEAPTSEEFKQGTLPQLIAAGITPEDAERVATFARDMFLYTWRGHKVMVTHAGLPTVPREPWLLASAQCWKGTGAWTDPVDARFDALAPEGWVQVHGHRNNGGLPVQASPRSFNLEDAVEHGGNLRIARLGAEGWMTESLRNRTFMPMRERMQRSIVRSKPLPAWMARPGDTRLPEVVVEAMRAHPGVNERASTTMPHIASFNFARDVFERGEWDAVSLKARGLFFNTETHEIVARAYEKFFNLGERPETRLDALCRTLHFPLHGYRKENGYLGLIGYDAASGDLFYSSKGTPDSPFAAWLREIHAETTTPGQREALRRWLGDMEGCLAVEVIDPEHDPHMIDYPTRGLVLLDVFRRSSEVERLPFERLEAFAKRFGFTPKQRDIAFSDAAQLRGWFAHVHGRLDHRMRGAMTEGLVVEDRDGAMFKIKFPAYAFWKSMRSGKDRLRRLRRVMDEAAVRGKSGVNAKAIEETIAHHDHPLARAFLGWANSLPSEALDASIIALRRGFMASAAYDPRDERVPWKPYADPAEHASSDPGAGWTSGPRVTRGARKP